MHIGLRSVLSFIVIVILSGFREHKQPFRYKVPTHLSAPTLKYQVGAISISTEPLQIPFTGQSYIGFKEALALKESSGNYASINTLGYLGKYQFGKNTLAFYGQENTSCFMNDPALQERIFFHNTARNKWILRRDIKRYVGVKMNGILISESGILAAAHLAGAGNVKKYLRSWGSQNFTDAYQTSIEDYLVLFSGFNLGDIKSTKQVHFI
jgi:hypothetical protein